ncbi:unnamed protein product [Cylicocyclus nassatus]|uniref:Uncharacterized protein n=1 Tax=Cylicocyclus nassatus TaxID=53992 RepID=A0AA36DWW4_CYLNA|nr:unnamed protein product [Cylicocyclus nassatus]
MGYCNCIRNGYGFDTKLAVLEFDDNAYIASDYFSTADLFRLSGSSLFRKKKLYVGATRMRIFNLTFLLLSILVIFSAVNVAECGLGKKLKKLAKKVFKYIPGHKITYTKQF